MSCLFSALSHRVSASQISIIIIITGIDAIKPIACASLLKCIYGCHLRNHSHCSDGLPKGISLSSDVFALVNGLFNITQTQRQPSKHRASDCYKNIAIMKCATREAKDFRYRYIQVIYFFHLKENARDTHTHTQINTTKTKMYKRFTV